MASSSFVPNTNVVEMLKKKLVSTNDLMAQYSRKCGEFDILDRQLAEKSTCIDQLKEQNHQQLQQMTQVYMELSTSKSQLLLHKDQIGALQVDKERLSAKVEEQRNKVEAAQKYEAQCNHKIEALGKKKDQLEDQLKSLTARNKQVTQEVQKLSGKMAAQTVEFDKQKVQLSEVREHFHSQKQRHNRLLKFADSLVDLLETNHLSSSHIQHALRRFHIPLANPAVNDGTDSDDSDEMGAQLESLLAGSEDADGDSVVNDFPAVDSSPPQPSSSSSKRLKRDDRRDSCKQVVEADSTQSFNDSPSPRVRIPHVPKPVVKVVRTPSDEAATSVPSTSSVSPASTVFLKKSPESVEKVGVKLKMDMSTNETPISAAVKLEASPSVSGKKFKRKTTAPVQPQPPVAEETKKQLAPLVKERKYTIADVWRLCDVEFAPFRRPPLSPIRDPPPVVKTTIEHTENAETASHVPTAAELAPSIAPTTVLNTSSVPNWIPTNVGPLMPLRKPPVNIPPPSRKISPVVIDNDVAATTRSSFRPSRPGVRATVSPIKVKVDERLLPGNVVSPSVSDMRRAESVLSTASVFEGFTEEENEAAVRFEESIGLKSEADLVVEAQVSALVETDMTARTGATESVEPAAAAAGSANSDLTAETEKPTDSAPVTSNIGIGDTGTTDMENCGGDTDEDVDDFGLSIDVDEQIPTATAVEPEKKPIVDVAVFSKSQVVPSEKPSKAVDSFNKSLQNAANVSVDKQSTVCQSTPKSMSNPAMSVSAAVTQSRKRRLPGATGKTSASSTPMMAAVHRIMGKTPKPPAKKARLDILSTNPVPNKLGVESINVPGEFVQLGKKPVGNRAGWTPAVVAESPSMTMKVTAKMETEECDQQPTTSLSCCVEQDMKVNQAAQRWVDSNLEKLLKNSIQSVTFLKQMEQSHHKFSTPVFVQCFVRAIVDRSGDILPALYTACARRNPVTMPYLSNDEHKLFNLIAELTVDGKFPDLRWELATELTRRLLTTKLSATQQNAVCRVVTELRRQLGQPGHLDRLVYEVLCTEDENVINMLVSVAAAWSDFFRQLLTSGSTARLAQLFLHLVASKQEQMRAKIQVVLESVVGFNRTPVALDLKEQLSEILSCLEVTPQFFASVTPLEFGVSDNVQPHLSWFLLLAHHVDMRPFGDRWMYDIQVYRTPGDFCEAEANYTAKSIFLLALVGPRAIHCGKEPGQQRKLSLLLIGLEDILTAEKNRHCLLIQYCAANCILRLSAFVPKFTSTVLTYWMSEKRGQIPKSLQDRFNVVGLVFNSKKKSE